jgi:hypothetical protein
MAENVTPDKDKHLNWITIFKMLTRAYWVLDLCCRATCQKLKMHSGTGASCFAAGQNTFQALPLNRTCEDSCHFWTKFRALQSCASDLVDPPFHNTSSKLLHMRHGSWLWNLCTIGTVYMIFCLGERIGHVLWHMLSYTIPEDVFHIIELLK